MICIEHAKAAFDKFIQQFDVNDPKISLKIRHTYCVMNACEYLAKEMNLDGFRIVNNCGDSAGQTVKHIHFHLMSGREFTWPAG